MNDSVNNGPRVECITVEGLFGLYDHIIHLNKVEHITVVHGPNGVGKTVLFKLTHALLTGRVLDLLKYPFQRFEVALTDGTRLEVMQDKQNAQAKTLREFKGDKRVGKAMPLRFKEVEHWAQQLEIYTPIREMSTGKWFDPEYEDTLNEWGVIDRYGQAFPEVGNTVLPRLPRGDKPPFSYLIAAQRLIHLVKPSLGDGFSGRMMRNNRSERDATALDTVLIYSRELRGRVDAKLAEYGRRSQELDQSFPQRLLQGRVESLAEGEIRTRMGSINARQERLQQLGLMAEAPQTHGAEGVLDESKRPVMTVYLSDMAQKLDVLEDLARKVEVLLTQVNAQFVNKKLVLDDRHELAVHTSQGERLPVSVLSSGEQHQIVLMYDLLFHVKPNTLVMIDEPELSLHMDWQERFIGNLQQIIAVTDFDVLLATHSPYIVNGHNDLLVALSAEPVATSMKQMN